MDEVPGETQGPRTCMTRFRNPTLVTWDWSRLRTQTLSTRFVNRRVRNRTHGGVGGRRGRPRLLPDMVGLPYAPPGTATILNLTANRTVTKFSLFERYI